MGANLDPELSRLIDEAVALLNAGDYPSAAPLYRSVLRRAPSLAGCWHDLGIATKHLGLWEECRRVNRRALELNPQDEGAAWNLGIAGTALGDWTVAREGWRAAGVSIPPGEGPVEMDLGSVPVRVGRDSSPEVVWCARIDPARAIILNVPTAGCARRYRDLVLHDGSREGERLLDGKPVPVFNELQLLAPSAFSTYEIRIDVGRPQDSAALEQLIDGSGSVCEDWTASIRNLCAACSEGNPDAGAHSHGFEEKWSGDRSLGVASDRGEADLHALVSRWLAGHDRPLLQRWARPRARRLVSFRVVTQGVLRA